MATVTTAHHGLIYGGRRIVILSLIGTLILAVVFVGCQGYEYYNAPFTFSDGVYGSTFFFATGFHGLRGLIKQPLLIKYKGVRELSPKGGMVRSTYHSTRKLLKEVLGREVSKSRVKELRLLNKNKEGFICRHGHFLEWFCGFTDSEGNFTITLRNKDDNNRPEASPYTSAMLTFQISLHLDDKKALERIKNKLQCGKISVSETNNKCNFFVNDIFSLVNIIQPIFENVQLNSSKNFQFQAFSKPVNLFNQKAHFTREGKMTIMDCKNKLNINLDTPKAIIITDAWLLGFIEGDGSFSTSGLVPRFKFENHIKELRLLEKIKEFCRRGGSLITKLRKRKKNENATY